MLISLLKTGRDGFGRELSKAERVSESLEKRGLVTTDEHGSTSLTQEGAEIARSIVAREEQAVAKRAELQARRQRDLQEEAGKRRAAADGQVAKFLTDRRAELPAVLPRSNFGFHLQPGVEIQATGDGSWWVRIEDGIELDSDALVSLINLVQS